MELEFKILKQAFFKNKVQPAYFQTEGLEAPSRMTFDAFSPLWKYNLFQRILIAGML
jgi:hypothetical protein